MAHWNLARLAESLLPLIDEQREVAIELAEDSLKGFEKIYKSKWLTMMGTKLGLKDVEPGMRFSSPNFWTSCMKIQLTTPIPFGI